MDWVLWGYHWGKGSGNNDSCNKSRVCLPLDPLISPFHTHGGPVDTPIYTDNSILDTFFSIFLIIHVYKGKTYKQQSLRRVAKQNKNALD